MPQHLTPADEQPAPRSTFFLEDVAALERTDLTEQYGALLRPVIEAGGGPVPGMHGYFLGFQYLTDWHGKRLGVEYFRITKGYRAESDLVVRAFFCWRDEQSAGAWAQAVASWDHAYKRFRAQGLWHPMTLEPPSAPWMASWMSPFCKSVPSEAVPTLRIIAQCVGQGLADYCPSAPPIKPHQEPPPPSR